MTHREAWRTSFEFVRVSDKASLDCRGARRRPIDCTLSTAGLPAVVNAARSVQSGRSAPGLRRPRRRSSHDTRTSGRGGSRRVVPAVPDGPSAVGISGKRRAVVALAA